MNPGRRVRAATAAVALVVTAAAFASCSSPPVPSASTTSAPNGGVGSSARKVGGTATWAEAPGAKPDYIFPFMNLAYFTVANIKQFQYLMYRPLYWFGSAGQPVLNGTLSLAEAPVYSGGDTTVVVKLKPYKWSDGETVTAQDVMFWMNMLHADKADWAAYTPSFIPDNVKDVKVDNANQLTFTLSGPVNPQWFTSDQLSQITPLPVAWDISTTGAAPGSGGCSTAAFGHADSKCNAVFTFLSKQAGNDPAKPTNSALPTYVTNPLWRVVDGPWKLASIDASGNASFVPNADYSGPTKPSLAKFVEVPFATEDDEYKALASGHVNFGYLPLSKVTKPTTNPLTPTRYSPRLAGYHLAPLYTWSINYFPENFNSSGDGGNAGNIWKQLYFRQAFQSLIDQPRDIAIADKGFAVPTYGPVPVAPANPFVSRLEKDNPYPYSLSKATALLRRHGWKVVPNGTSSCIRPGAGAGERGTGIPAGARLAFNLEFASGDPSMTTLMKLERASWAQVGINVTLSEAPFNTVIGDATACSPGPSCMWELENWGAGWVYTPDYYPTGEENLSSTATPNVGSYRDATNDHLIEQSHSTPGSLTSWENYLAQQLPVVWQPNPVSELSEIQNDLRGVLPQDTSWNINPENWYFAQG